MSRHAVYAISKNEPHQPLYIRDVGPWDRYLTVTNDAEWVVEQLASQGFIPPGRRLLYKDSEGEWGEILVKDRVFAGFRNLVQDEGAGGP